MGDTSTKAKSWLANAEQKVEDHPGATAVIGAVLIYGAVKLGTKKPEE